MRSKFRFFVDGQKRLAKLITPPTLAVLASATIVWGTPPAWWNSRGVTNADAPQNQALITQGQLKNLVKAAYDELETNLPGGAGAALEAYLWGGTTSGDGVLEQAGSPYTPVLNGEIKHVAALFLDRLAAEGYFRPNGSEALYPWSNLAPGSAEYYRPVKIGQVKYLFGFDLTRNVDGDNLPDWQEIKLLREEGSLTNYYSDYTHASTTHYPEFSETTVTSSVGAYSSGGEVEGPTINVVDYGAVPNDSSDDSSSIAAAIAASTAGDTVYFPAGEYWITAPIALKSGITLAGASRESVTLKFVGTQPASCMVVMNKMSNTTITALTLDANHNPNAERGILTDQSNGLVIQGIKIQNTVANGRQWGVQGIYSYSAMHGGLIADNIFESMAPNQQYGAAIFLEGSTNNTIENNIITDTGRGGILIKRSTGHVIRNNVITGTGLNWSGSGWGDNALAIEIHTECNDTLIEGNIMDHWLSVDQSSRCAIRNNTVTDTSGRIKVIGLEMAGGSDNIFSDNTVGGGAQIGISISKNYAKDRVLWARNHVLDSNTWGVQIQGDAIGTSRHYFYQNEIRGTLKDAPYALAGGQGYGFRFNKDAEHITLDQNLITENENGGIQTSIEIDFLSFIGNTITDNGGPSITADPASANLEWSGNIVTGNTANTQLSSRGFSNQKPSASFTLSGPVYAGTPVTMTSTSSDSDGSIQNYLWDLGEGLPSTAPNPTHTFSEPGDYQVILVVWDDGGRADLAEQVITVVAAP